MIPLGMLAGAKVSVLEMIYKNFLPTTLGNTVAGSLIVAGGYSYAFGRLGSSTPSLLPLSRISREDLPVDGASQPEAGGDVVPAADAKKAESASESKAGESAVEEAALGA